MLLSVLLEPSQLEGTHSKGRGGFLPIVPQLSMTWRKWMPPPGVMAVGEKCCGGGLYDGTKYQD